MAWSKAVDPFPTPEYPLPMTETPKPQEQATPPPPPPPPPPLSPERQKLACDTAGELFGVLQEIRCLAWGKFMVGGRKLETGLDVRYTFDQPAAFEAVSKRPDGPASVKKFAEAIDSAAKALSGGLGGKWEGFYLKIDKTVGGEVGVTLTVDPPDA